MIHATPRSSDTASEADIIVAWWRGLRRRRDQGDGSARAAISALRHARPGESVHVLGQPDVIALLRRLHIPTTVSEQRIERILGLVRVLAQLKGEAVVHPARALGQPQKRPRLSALGLQRLLRSRTPEELERSLSRAIELLDKRAEPHALAETMLFWGDHIRVRWQLEYNQLDPPES